MSDTNLFIREALTSIEHFIIWFLILEYLSLEIILFHLIKLTFMLYILCFVLQLMSSSGMHGSTKESPNQDVVFITFGCNEKIALNNIA